MDNSILIIGPADTSYAINTIVKQDSKKLVDNLYGETSDLAAAFNTSLSMGAKDIYLANVQTKTTYIDIMQLAKHQNFTYIVPIGIRFSDRIFNKELNKQMTYTEVFLDIISSSSSSILIMTDNHSSLYEDIDSYLFDMINKITSFKIEAESSLNNGRQLWFVANNFEKTKIPNVILASAMCVTELPNYPEAKFPNSIFNLDETDILNNEIIYFKNNINSDNSVENFINFHNEHNAYKIALIDMVIREINEEIDLSQFCGRLFNNQIKLKIQSILQKYLMSKKGVLIRDFKIIQISSYLVSDYSYIIVAYFKILPMNSLEECDVVIEV